MDELSILSKQAANYEYVKEANIKGIDLKAEMTRIDYLKAETDKLRAEIEQLKSMQTSTTSEELFALHYEAVKDAPAVAAALNALTATRDRAINRILYADPEYRKVNDHYIKTVGDEYVKLSKKPETTTEA